MNVLTWQTAAQQSPPAPGEIHVWRIDLATDYGRHADVALLSPDERERAARLLIEHKQAQFIAGRSAVRRLLGRYLGVPPQALAFRYGPYGKPALGIEHTAAALAFNFSNSEDLALLAVTTACVVGADIEYRHRNINAASFARHILSGSETATFERLAPARQKQALLATWTRKEAYLKALGTGIARPMTGFSTGIANDDEPAVRRLEDADGELRTWKFTPLAVHPDYLACVSAPGSAWTLRCFDWLPVP
jgi:4'-phosphopantetheinyl transferase